MSAPAVSVVVPCFNYGHLLRSTLESVQAQTLQDWECLIVDDGSTDDTAEVAAKFAGEDGRFKYVPQRNRGLSAARNLGIAHASGRHFQFLDADDWIESAKLSFQSRHLDEHPETGLIYGSMRYFPHENATLRLLQTNGAPYTLMPELSGPGAVVLQHLVRQNIMVVNCPLLRRETIEQVGPFDEELSACEDWHYWIRCAAAGASFLFNAAEGTLALVRFHRESMSRDPLRMLDNALLMRRKIRPLLADERLRAGNEENIVALDEWLARTRRLLALLAAEVPPGQRYLLIDEDRVNPSGSLDGRAVPFPESSGYYGGPPAEEACAVRELERRKGEGILHVAVAWPAFWWLDFYQDLSRWLRESSRQVVRTEDVVLFCLKS